MKVVVVGDIIVDKDIITESVKDLTILEGKEYDIVSLVWESKDKLDFSKKAQNLELNGPGAESVPEALLKEIVDADILLVHFCPLSRETLNHARKLKLIGTCRGGLEHIDLKAASEMNIPVVHVIRNAEATSDLTIGLMFAETRNIARSHAALMQGEWKKEYVNSKFTKSMNNMSVGIIGLGNIGLLVAEKCAALKMKVRGYDAFMSPDAVSELPDYVEWVEKETLFSESDIVSVHLRLSEATENFVNKDVLNLMKPTSYLINTSRAGCVNRDDLIDALKLKTIGGCALDVFWTEPLPKDDDLLKLENVTLTPHTAGNVFDALPMSPFLLASTINEFTESKIMTRVANKKDIEVKI